MTTKTTEIYTAYQQRHDILIARTIRAILKEDNNSRKIICFALKQKIIKDFKV